MKFDSLHFALIAIVVLLAVYGFGSGEFREGVVSECSTYATSSECERAEGCEWDLLSCINKKKVEDIIHSACSYEPKANNCKCDEKYNERGPSWCGGNKDCAGKRWCGNGRCHGCSDCDGGC